MRRVFKHFKKRLRTRHEGISLAAEYPRQLLIFILAFLFMSVLHPTLFLTKRNILSMAWQFPEYGLLAFGVMLAMIAGGIDLSLIGTANLTSILTGLMLSRFITDSMPTATQVLILLGCISISLLVGALCGLFTGYLIAGVKVPAMLATLGNLQLFTGISLVLTKGKAVSGVPSLYVEFGTTEIFGILPVALLIYIAVMMWMYYVVEKSSFGVKLRMMGTNSKASTFAGQNNLHITAKAHMYGGIIAAMTGLIMLARLNSARPDFGSSYTMQSILIVVLGGVSPYGGFGSVIGVVIATMILQVLSSGLNMFTSVSPYIKELAWGLVLLIVMIISYYSDKKKKQRE